jgi:hypothetical protein
MAVLVVGRLLYTTVAAFRDSTQEYTQEVQWLEEDLKALDTNAVGSPNLLKFLSLATHVQHPQTNRSLHFLASGTIPSAFILFVFENFTLNFHPIFCVADLATQMQINFSELITDV